jgi:hypothetical protein
MVRIVTPGCLGFLTACSHLSDPAPPQTALSAPIPQQIATVWDFRELHLPQNPVVGSVGSEIPAMPIPPTETSARTEPFSGIVILPQDGGRAVIIEIPPPRDFRSAMPILPPPERQVSQ